MLTLFRNARIWTADDRCPHADAMLIADDRIVAVGREHDIALPPDTDIIDLGGARVLPGFVDAHWHFLARTQDSFYMLGNVAAIQERLALLDMAQSGDGWIRDGGWAYADFLGNIPDRCYLDAVVPDRPVWLVARDGHMGLANSAALALLGIDQASEAPENSIYQRDVTGRLTGEIKGSAVLQIDARIPAPSVAEARAVFAAAMRRANAHGITSVHNVHQWSQNELHAVIRARAEGELTLRIRSSHWLVGPEAVDEDGDTLLAGALAARAAHAGDAMLDFGSVKVILDGTIDAGTAHMREPLTDGSPGIAYFDQDALDAAVLRYDAQGFQVLAHATGDAAIGQMIDAVERALRVNGPRDARHRVEHIDIPGDEDLYRMQTLGIVACSQPNFAYPDETNLENYAMLLGPERTRRAQCFARIDAAGVTQAFGSDYPISSMDHLRAIHTAVTRQTREGTPAEGWNPQEAISVETALRHLTRDAAYASHREKSIGRLAPGLFADFVVLTEDILVDDPEVLLRAEVEQTWLGGAKRFDAALAGYPRQVLPGRNGTCPCCRAFAEQAPVQPPPKSAVPLPLHH